MDEKEKELLLGSLFALCEPEKVILHGAKHGLSNGRLKSINLCIVVSTCDKEQLLRRLYLELPLDFQVNVNLYTLDEWEELSADLASHAAWIAQKGTVLYEA